MTLLNFALYEKLMNVLFSVMTCSEGNLCKSRSSRWQCHTRSWKTNQSLSVVYSRRKGMVTGLLLGYCSNLSILYHNHCLHRSIIYWHHKLLCLPQNIRIQNSIIVVWFVRISLCLPFVFTLHFRFLFDRGWNL